MSMNEMINGMFIKLERQFAHDDWWCDSGETYRIGGFSGWCDSPKSKVGLCYRENYDHDFDLLNEEEAERPQFTMIVRNSLGIKTYRSQPLGPTSITLKEESLFRLPPHVRRMRYYHEVLGIGLGHPNIFKFWREAGAFCLRKERIPGWG